MNVFDKLTRLRGNDLSLRCVSIHSFRDEQKEKDYVAQRFPDKSPDLSSTLALNIFPATGLNEASVRDLADALRSNVFVIMLDIAYCDIGDGGAAAIADVLRHNRSLTHLYLCGCFIGDDGAKAIAAALFDNDRLFVLSLRSNRIGAAGAVAIANALSERNDSRSRSRSRSVPLQLFLSNNAIGDVGVRAIADMLRTNQTITALYLQNCGMGDEAAEALAAAIVANDTMKWLYLDNNCIGDVGAKALACANLLRIRFCDIDLGNNRRVGDEGKKALDLSRRLCQNEDVGACDVHEAIALVEDLLPATNFLSLAPHKLSAHVAANAATLRSENSPKPGRLAILDRALERIDQVLAKTRPIQDAAMPLALENIGGGGQDGMNVINSRNEMGIDDVIVVSCDKTHLLRTRMKGKESTHTKTGKETETGTGTGASVVSEQSREQPLTIFPQRKKMKTEEG